MAASGDTPLQSELEVLVLLACDEVNGAASATVRACHPRLPSCPQERCHSDSRARAQGQRANPAMTSLPLVCT